MFDCSKQSHPKVYFTFPELVQCGNELSYEKVRGLDPPAIKFSGVEIGQTYFVVMMDPDAPSKEHPSSANWLHWMVADIKYKDLEKGNLLDSSNSNQIIKYNPPTPPKSSGLHRYGIFIFNQHGAPPEPPDGRNNFDLDDFVKNNNLLIVASTFFQTQQ